MDMPLYEKTLPYPIAFPVARMNADNDHHHKLQWLYYAFENAQKFIGLSLAMSYLLSRGKPSVEFNAILKELRQPSLGHWTALLAESFRYFDHEGIVPFLAGFFDFYEYCEKNQRRKIVLQVKEGKIHEKESGIISSLVAIRNQHILAHGILGLTDESAIKMWDTCSPIFFDYLKSIEFLAGYTLYRVLETLVENRVRALSLTGAQIDEKNLHELSVKESSAVLLHCRARDSFQPVYPFMVKDACIENIEDPLLTEELKREQLFIYNGSNGKEVIYLGLGIVSYSVVSKMHFQKRRPCWR